MTTKPEVKLPPKLHKEIETYMAPYTGETRQRVRDFIEEYGALCYEAGLAEKATLNARIAALESMLSNSENEARAAEESLVQTPFDSARVKEAEDHIRGVMEYAFSHGHGELGYDPVAVIKQSLAQPAQEPRRDDITLVLDREHAGVVYDGLILERERSLERKKINPESNSHDRAIMCKIIMDKIRDGGEKQPAQERTLSTDLSERLLYLADLGGEADYTHTMRAAAKEIERCHGSIMAWRYAAAAQQPAQAAVPEGWQPIETAPKDGAEIIVFHPLAGVCAAFCPGDGFAWHCMDGQNTVIGSKSKTSIPRMTSFIKPPTHWMPLPVPPAMLNAAPESGDTP